jgi:hypothetical protein
MSGLVGHVCTSQHPPSSDRHVVADAMLTV